MTESVSTKAPARANRERADEYREKGWVRNGFWLSPAAIAVLEELRDEMGLRSRAPTVNAILERIGQERSVNKGFLAVTK
jgi:hypothetical protein